MLPSSPRIIYFSMFKSFHTYRKYIYQQPTYTVFAWGLQPPAQFTPGLVLPFLVYLSHCIFWALWVLKLHIFKNQYPWFLLLQCCFWAKNIFIFLPRMVAAHRPKEIKYATSKLLKFKIEVDHLVPKIPVIHIPGNYIRQGCTVPESWVQWRAVFQSGSRVSKKVLWNFSYLHLWPSMWLHAEKWLKTPTFWKLLNSLYNLGSRAKKSPKIPPKNFALNRNLLNFLHR